MTKDSKAAVPADIGESCSIAPSEEFTANRAATVLVADSDWFHRTFVTIMLLSAGYAVVPASSGIEAFARINAGGIDLMVTNVTLPGMDAIELLRAFGTASVCPPVIVVANGGTTFDGICLKSASLYGAARTYSQPLVPSLFLHDVEQLLKK
jgi:CheY-like chemotaxis protein